MPASASAATAARAATSRTSSRARTAAPGANEFWALRNVTFSVRPGEAIGVVGRNGQGKSTLLKLVAEVILPDEGTVERARRRRSADRDHRRLRRRPHGARQRVPHRRTARDDAARDRGALRRDHRLRRDPRLPRHPVQAPVERHEGADRVRGDLAARGADHPRRRGARGRRQGVPREVLPPHRGAARRRSHAVLRLAQREGPAPLLHARPLPRQGRARARCAHRRGARPLQREVRGAASPALGRRHWSA